VEGFGTRYEDGNEGKNPKGACVGGHGY